MDDLEKKFFCQLDNDNAAIGEKARLSFAKSLKAKHRTCRDELQEIERGEEAQQKYTALDTKYQEALAHNTQWTQRDQAMQQQLAQVRQENAELKRRVRLFQSVTWLRLNKIKVALCGVLLAAGITGYHFYDREQWPADAEAGMRNVARNAVWGEWFDKPFVTAVGNKSYWILLQGTVDTSSFSDKQGRPIVMRCLHVFAVQAHPDSGEFRRADPYGLIGRLRWPERLVQCQPSPDQKEAQR